MKCEACKYETGWDIDNDCNIGDECFIETVLMLSFEHNYREMAKLVYICPKCGTLKIDI